MTGSGVIRQRFLWRNTLALMRTTSFYTALKQGSDAVRVTVAAN